MLAEKGSGDNDDVELIRAAAAFRLVATMNPGGDFGKKEVDKKNNVAVLHLPVIDSTKNVNTMFVPKCSSTFVLSFYQMCNFVLV